MKGRALRRMTLSIAGSCILAFGLRHVHLVSSVTEGGVLGLTLLLHHWLGVSPAWSGLLMNCACYILGAKVLGREFVLYSAVSGGGFSLFYALFELMAPLWPGLALHPFAAALSGAAFVGVGVGLCVRAGGAPSGDDALAMSLSRLLRQPIQRVYLVSDLLVLALSLSYIPTGRIVWSLLTVALSGQLIGLLQRENPFVRAKA